ncbi:Imm52 family immunity protein [Devosia sp. CN2-171]|uniref:Imm52 family immunity protein n=1 Tax=Devosia sp. CN2-171 TaxID=3400909 RepID=UPI003BF905FE
MVGVYWAARQESLDACAERLRRHFDLLSELSEWTRVWYRRPNSVRKGSVPTSLASHNDLVRLLGRGVNRRDDNREPIVDLGWQLHLWNGYQAATRARRTFIADAIPSGLETTRR